MTTVTVQAGTSSYPVHIGNFAWENLGLDSFSRVAFVSDTNVVSALRIEGLHPWILVEPGEQSKSVDVWHRCLNTFSEHGLDRHSAVIAVGGGVVGDLAGFAAASYMRGIPWFNVATSLLAQVDAAIGGKTGIDTEHGKNLVGAFHQPRAVFCDPAHLRTLPERHVRNGMAEVIKYGFIASPEVLELAEKGDYVSIVEACVRIKADIVQRDPLEQTGVRAVLNFGHTVGHAIESAMNYSGVLHGEAVAIGMLAECLIGEALSVTPAGTADLVRAQLTNAGLPTSLPVEGLIPQILHSMMHDKKNRSGRLSMALLEEVGSCRLATDVDLDTVQKVLDSL